MPTITERIIVQLGGNDPDPVPPAAEEEINDAIHQILRENYGIDTDVVYWEMPTVHPDPDPSPDASVVYPRTTDDPGGADNE